MCSKPEYKIKKSQLENSFIFVRFPNLGEVSIFFEYHLEKLLDNSMKSIVIDNLNNVFVDQKVKNGRNYMRDLFRISKEKQINIIYVNDLFYTNHLGLFSLEISFGEIVNEFCSHILLISDYKRETVKDDILMESEINVIKSNFFPKEKMLIYINLNKFSFILKKPSNLNNIADKKDSELSS